jgi:hypothetical protein
MSKWCLKVTMQANANFVLMVHTIVLYTQFIRLSAQMKQMLFVKLSNFPIWLRFILRNGNDNSVSNLFSSVNRIKHISSSSSSSSIFSPFWKALNLVSHFLLLNSHRTVENKHFINFLLDTWHNNYSLSILYNFRWYMLRPSHL